MFIPLRSVCSCGLSVALALSFFDTAVYRLRFASGATALRFFVSGPTAYTAALNMFSDSFLGCYISDLK
jgi:hypothetical protein